MFVSKISIIPHDYLQPKAMLAGIEFHHNPVRFDLMIRSDKTLDLVNIDKILENSLIPKFFDEKFDKIMRFYHKFAKFRQ